MCLQLFWIAAILIPTKTFCGQAADVRVKKTSGTLLRKWEQGTGLQVGKIVNFRISPPTLPDF
jgi:hypothetical protein